MSNQEGIARALGSVNYSAKIAVASAKSASETARAWADRNTASATGSYKAAIDKATEGTDNLIDSLLAQFEDFRNEAFDWTSWAADLAKDKGSLAIEAATGSTDSMIAMVNSLITWGQGKAKEAVDDALSLADLAMTSAINTVSEQVTAMTDSVLNTLPTVAGLMILGFESIMADFAGWLWDSLANALGGEELE